MKTRYVIIALAISVPVWSMNPYFSIGFDFDGAGRSSALIPMTPRDSTIVYPGSYDHWTLPQMPKQAGVTFAAFFTSPIHDTLHWINDSTLTYTFDRGVAYFTGVDGKTQSPNGLPYDINGGFEGIFDGSSGQIWFWFYGDSVKTRINWIYLSKNRTYSSNYCTKIVFEYDSAHNRAMIGDVPTLFSIGTIFSGATTRGCNISALVRQSIPSPLTFPTGDTGSIKQGDLNLDIVVKRSASLSDTAVIYALNLPVAGPLSGEHNFAYSQSVADVPFSITVGFSKSDQTTKIIQSVPIVKQQQIFGQTRSNVLANGRAVGKTRWNIVTDQMRVQK